MQGAPERKKGDDGLPIPPYAVYNIGGGQPENLLDFVTILQEELVRAGVLPQDFDFEAHKQLVPMQPGDVPTTYADATALERDYGFTPKNHLVGTTAKYVRESVSAILSSVFYQFASYVDDYLRVEHPDTRTDSSRSRRMFEDFMKLVKDNHHAERMVGFYADRLCVTPKYLSKVVKEVSGRSAPEWIDGFVIMSAKSMLKYSDMTVKEIAIELNFPNQSFFSKFFKSQTGATPNEYREK